MKALLIPFSIILVFTFSACMPQVSIKETVNNYKLNEPQTAVVGGKIIDVKENMIKKYKLLTITKIGSYEKGKMLFPGLYEDKATSERYFDISIDPKNNERVRVNLNGEIQGKQYFKVIPYYQGLLGAKSYELLYLGKFDGNIKVAYREYVGTTSGTLIRGDFNYELFYNLNDSKTIRFQNYVINVLSADNEKMEYIVKDDIASY